MIFDEMERFDQFLSESFGEGIHFRELRLSTQEVDYIKQKYPEANIRRSPAGQCSDGKVWYEISLATQYENERESVISKQITAVQQENIQLKQELSKLKRTMALSSKNS